MRRVRTQVAIVGAGPAGLVTAAVLARAGVDHVVVERRSRAHLEGRGRAGVLEHRTVEFLRGHGLARRLTAEGHQAGWSDFQVLGHRTRLDYEALTGCRHWVYPQQLLVRDLCDELAALGHEPLFSHPVREVRGLTGATPEVLCDDGGDGLGIDCDFVIGCDGFQGVTRTLLPGGPDAPRDASFRHPYETLTVLAEVESPAEGVLYSLTEDGFAGMMPRSRHLSRFYLQIAPGETVADWPERRIREELIRRLRGAGDDGGGSGDGAPRLGAITDVGTLLMRSHICGTPRHGRLLLAGDAAHILTPFGGKGANLAVADVADLTQALVAHYKDGDDRPLDTYGERRLREAWRVQEFSDRLMRLVMLPPGFVDPAGRRFVLGLKRASLERVTQGPDAEAFAHQYVGSGFSHFQ